jgi:hypothetical protein
MTPDRWFDLGLNLFAEVLGIIIAVFWIDRLLKRREKEREEKRWMPPKNHIYSEMMSICTNILREILPREYMKQVDTLFLFGKSPSIAFFEIIPGANLELPHLLDETKKRLSIFKDKPHGLENNLEKISDLLGKDAFLLDPDLLSLIYDLKKYLDALIGYEATVDWRKEFPTTDPSIIFTHVSLSALTLRSTLEKRAKVVPAPEEMKEYIKDLYEDNFGESPEE